MERIRQMIKAGIPFSFDGKQIHATPHNAAKDFRDVFQKIDVQVATVKSLVKKIESELIDQANAFSYAIIPNECGFGTNKLGRIAWVFTLKALAVSGPRPKENWQFLKGGPVVVEKTGPSTLEVQVLLPW